ncbi:class II heat shock protein [Artemisia annua]|uniref:Class II heat shock protein n=1 Tax=Artemisia annua TaxID=35608 RepID=A0A2U1N7Z2_ARTAN|nr:class II heat shock protein [Artemisia annua]
MASGGSDRDVEYTLSKLLQMGTVAEYESEFMVLANRVTRISESLLTSLYISGLKLTLQIEVLRARPKTLGEAFSLAYIVEARFEAIAEKEKEHIIEKKSDTIPSLQSEFVSPEIKGSLDVDKDIAADEVRSAIDGVFDIGESLVVILKWVHTSTSRTLLLLVTFENIDVAMRMEAKIQRRTWDPGIKIYFRHHLEGKKPILMDISTLLGLDSPLFLHNLHHILDDTTNNNKSTKSEPTRAYVRDARAMAATPADVKEYPNAYVFIVDMPGLKSGDIKVQVEDDNVLVISGERKREEEEKEGVKYVRMERRIGKFMRKFSLPENANIDKISAVCQDGVLTVTVEKLPPPEPKKPKLIQVQVA